MNVTQHVIRLSDELESHTLEIRRTIHRNPELSFKEAQTAALVCAELERMGIPYERSPVEYGVVATIDSRKPGRLLMLRADMDALPIHEETDLPFRSRVDNVMHACGHDVHTANLLAVAEILSRTRDLWTGKARLVFQTAEENGGGGREMIAHGLLDELPDACLALHVMPFEKGRLLIGSEYISSYSDGCMMTIHGKAAHSSAPQKGVDAINIAASVIVALNSVIAKNIDPMENSTLNVGLISGGVAANVIAEKAELSCMMRNITPEARTAMMESIRSIAEGVTTAMGGHCDLRFRTGYPAVFNDPKLTGFVVDCLGKHAPEIFAGIGSGEVPEGYLTTGKHPSLIAEDFGFYAQKMPSCFIQAGTGAYAPAHNSRFSVDEDYIKFCTRTLSLAALDYLKTA